MAAARAKPNLPVQYDEQLAREAAEIAKRIAAPTGDRIRFNGNSGFITPDGMEGKTLSVVIVEFFSSNMFYDGVFDRDNPQPPACFAIGPEPALLIPSANSPAKQAQTCTACPMNQFGSGATGKGKACKNTRLLALMPANAPAGEDAPIWIMSVPPTSLKSFDSYVASLAAKHKTIPIGVVTQITLDPTNQYASPRFAIERPLTGKDLGPYMSRREEAAQRLTAEPDVSQYVPPKSNVRGAPTARGRR